MADPTRESPDWILDIAGRVVDGCATPSEVSRFEAHLTAHKADRQRYLRYALLHAQLGLTDEALSANFPTPAPSLHGSFQSASRARGPFARLPRRWRTPALLAAMALALLLAVIWQQTRPRVEMIRVVGSVFADAAEPAAHANLIGYRFELTSGLVELAFRKASATVVVEAPAAFRVEDAKTLRVEYGRVAAHVVDGVQGLRVLTPDMNVLDLGTRFAVDVTPGERSEIHVLEGIVKAGVAGSERDRELRARESLRFEGGRSPELCELRNGAFIQPEEMAGLAAAMHARQDERAARAAAQLKEDPALLAFIDFDPAQDRNFVEHGGEIVGARSVQGRFPGGRAVEFVDNTDHVKVNFDAHASQFTLMTWVRLNQVLDRQNSLYSADGWNARGQVHWQIANSERFPGLMRLAINGAPESDETRRGEARQAIARGSLFDELERWAHVAAVYDADTQRASLYINGRLDSEAAISESIPAVLGPAQIGNWQPLDRWPRRRLSGRMDEFVALSRALSAAEIEAYYRDTNPYK